MLLQSEIALSFCGALLYLGGYTGSMLRATLNRGNQLSRALLIGVLLTLSFGPLTETAQACGASAGGGAVAVCSVAEMRESSRHKWHVGAGYSWSTTRLVFHGNSLEEKAILDQERQLVAASLEWRFSPRWNFRAGAGALVAGSLGSGAVLVQMKPGLALMLGASYLALAGTPKSPFLLLDAGWSSLFAGTEPDVPYSAHDLRLGGTFGMTFFRLLSPYALARVFGGPVFWELGGAPVQGTDRYHYQLGLGISVLIFSRFDFFVEGVPLGEQGISVGLGFSF